MSYTIGKHPAKSRAAVLGQANTGTYQVGVEFEFTDGPNAGQRITWYGYFTDAAQERTFESLRIAGFQGDDLSDLSSLSREDVPTVQLVLDEEDYNGEPQVKVKWVNRLGGPAVGKPLDGSSAKDFALRMRAHLIAHDKAAGAGQPKVGGAAASKPKRAPKQPATPEPEPDADIPF